ncbi:MAG: hypothetical protein JST46_04795 [Bacteroidetes bacterium]|nr:hypothetical protein [Bacteroidota bacterium]
MALLTRILRRSSQFAPWMVVRWALVLAAICFGIALTWLRREYGQPDSNVWLVMGYFLQLLLWSVLGMVVVTLTSSLVCWLMFRYQYMRGKIKVEVQLGDGLVAEAGRVRLTVQVKGPVWRPFLGLVRGSIAFRQESVPHEVLLDHNLRAPREWRRFGIAGHGTVWLHNRGIHDAEGVWLFFQDLFGLVSWPSRVLQVHQLVALPVTQPTVKVHTQPFATEEQKYRIDVPRRVEGELVNYKEFETGDNIHRIVWKIYAKSGELVVRIPEIKDPYASHVYLYMSFFRGFGEEGPLEVELLNVYKDRCRQLWESMGKSGHQIRLPHDQEIPQLAGVGDRHTELVQMAAQRWQTRLTPSEFVNPQKAALVCVSSMVPAEEVQTLLKKVPEHVPVVVVKLSTAIPSPFRISLRDIFFRPEGRPADRLRQPWLLSSLRKKVLQNEQAVNNMLRTRANAWLTDTLDITS